MLLLHIIVQYFTHRHPCITCKKQKHLLRLLLKIYFLIGLHNEKGLENNNVTNKMTPLYIIWLFTEGTDIVTI